jgi:hypothetical protein
MTTRTARPFARGGLVLILLAFAAAPVGAATQLQGFYEAFGRGQSIDGTWQFDRPNHYLEMRVLSDPWRNWEAFVEGSVNSSRYQPVQRAGNLVEVQRHSPELLFNEGHVRWRREHAEVVAFSHQNRFWFSQPLLGVVDGNQFSDERDGPRSQAIRSDFWDLAGFGGLFYLGSKSTNSEDFYAGRAWRRFQEGKILLGGTFGRKDYDGGDTDRVSTENYDMAGAVDLELALGELIGPLGGLGRFTLVMEAGRNFSGERTLPRSEEDRNGYQMELRDVRWSSLTFKGQAWYREQNFHRHGLNYRDGEDDRRGYWGELWWRLPAKQVDLRYSHWSNEAWHDVGSDGELVDEFAHELELYAELKGGISSWVKYRYFQGNDDPVDGGEYQNLIFQLQAQNRLISVRPQVRFRDFGTRREVQGYGMEVNLNVSSRWKVFGRFLNANEQNESRDTFFIQARFDAWSNSEFFIEYGDGGRSDRLTENDGFVDIGPDARSQDDDRRVQLILKLWF